MPANPDRPTAPLTTLTVGGQHDPARRRRTVRRGRERGCWLYVPAELLRAIGVEPTDPPPWYRTWPGQKNTVLVQLYTEP